MASLRWVKNGVRYAPTNIRYSLRGRYARIALHTLADRPTNTQKLLLRAARKGVRRQAASQAATNPRAERIALPQSLLRHVVLVVLIGAIVWGDYLHQWSFERIEHAQVAQQDGSAEQAHFWQSEIVRAVAPIDMNADSREPEQIAPIIQTPRTIAHPIFEHTYTLKPNDTIESIAAANGVSVESVIWANNLQEGAVLAVGRELRIPRISGVPHVVAPGETVDRIAKLYDVPLEAIELLEENRIRSGTQPPVGAELFVPNAHPQPPERLIQLYGSIEGLATQPARLAGMVREPQTNIREGPGRSYPRIAQLDRGWIIPLARHENWIKLDLDGQAGWVLIDLIEMPQGLYDSLPETNEFPPPPVVWVWPARGTLTSPFGQRWGALHNGIDIANNARTPIIAARSGTVFEAGWCSGFGYCVKIAHGNGMETIYGHLFSKPPVHAGESVDVGQYIGAMGSTYDARGGGYSTGVHLHFTVKINGRAVDPLKYLP